MKEAWTFLREGKIFDLLLLDVTLPDGTGAICSGLQGNSVKRAALSRELSAVTGLLQQCVPSDVIASSFSNETITEEAKELLGQIGHTKTPAYHFFPWCEKKRYCSARFFCR